MTRSRILMMVLAFALSATLAKSDQIPDPIIKTGGSQTQAPTRQSAAPAPAGIITSSFSISSKTGTSPGTSPCVLTQGGLTTVSPKCLFENDISTNGVADTITSLIFDLPTVPFGPQDQCGFLTGSPFTSCGVDPLTDGGTEFSFTGGSIAFHTDFSLDFEGFPANTVAGATAMTASPEPATLGLFLSGLTAAFVRRRARTKA